MDDDFFMVQGQTATLPNQTNSTMPIDSFQPSTHNNAQDDEFQFQEPQNASSPFDQVATTYTAEENAALIRMREEEERIQAQLRQKADQEYQEKIRRKEKGQKELEEFLEKKQKEKQQRRQNNIQKQAQTKEEYKQLNEHAGWKKVAVNIPIKQGEHPGKKNINRMREAIVNKRNDEQKM